MSVFGDVSVIANAFGYSDSLCWCTVLQCGCLLPLLTCCFLIALLAELANYYWTMYVLRIQNRGALAARSRSFEMPRFITVQFSRYFISLCVRLWNGLNDSVFAGEGLGAFKTSVNRFLLQDWLTAVSSCPSTISLSSFFFSEPKTARGSFL